MPGDAKVEVDYQKCLAALLHRFFDPYPDSALLCLRELFAENRSAFAAQNDFVFWGEAAVGFQHLLVVYRHRARGYSLSRRRTREREYLARYCVESRRCYGDARFLYIYLRRANLAERDLFSLERSASRTRQIIFDIFRGVRQGYDVAAVGLNTDVSDALARNTDDLLDSLFPLYLDALKNPYIRQKAEQFRNRRLAQTDLATPLPDVHDAELIRNLNAKFPGRFLIIDFWGMTCGPCRAAIQASKELRARVAKRDDVKLIFIAGERTAEGSEAYHNYVNEWLANEETVCLTNRDFDRLRELFQFNGIPHYETITPDGRRVREDLSIHGYDDFDYELQRLKEKLK